jgi:hypothetical protein
MYPVAAGTDDQELIASQARDKVTVGYGLLELGSQNLQHKFSRVVPVYIVDRFEVISIDHHAAECCAAAGRVKPELP